MLHFYTFMRFTFIIFFCIPTIALSAQTWTQQGLDIDGEAANDLSGFSVSLSSDGSTVAIGASLNNGNGVSAGHVRIYKNKNGTWTQQGLDIDGEAVRDESGFSVSLSSDGSIVAIGADQNDGNGNVSGHVRVFQNVNGSWTQVGSDINGEAAADFSGWSVSLSSDGSTVAIGGPGNDGNGSSSGHVRVYKNISGTWTQVGADIDGKAAEDQFARSVSISSDGSIVAMGAPYNDGNGLNSGQVRIYKIISGTWIQQGSDIKGEAADDYSGHSVSLSSDGSTVAIGAPGNDGNGKSAGHVRIYKNISGTWTQIGSDIDGEAADDQSGYSVSLSSDGSIVAVSAPNNVSNGTVSGHVRIYKNKNGTWTQQGTDIDGEASGGNWYGYSVSLSSDGSIVAIGAPNNDGNGTDAGHVRVYKTCIADSKIETITACNSYTWTNGITYTQSNNTAKDTFVNIAGCDSIVTLNLTITNSDLISKQPTNLSLFKSQNATFDIETIGTLSLTFQWQTDLGVGFQKMFNIGQYSGTQTKNLIISNVTSANDKQKFRCIVNYQYCSDTSDAVVLSLYGVGVNNLNDYQISHIYPNPVSKELNITIESNLLGSTYSIINPLGQEIKQGKLYNLNSTIDVSKLAKGVYIMIIGDVYYSHPFLVE